MKCPHCFVEIHEDFQVQRLGNDSDGTWGMCYMICPNKICGKLIVKLVRCTFDENSPYDAPRIKKIFEGYFVKPRFSSIPPVPEEVDLKFAKDYNEAYSIISISPQASAALSRRCLQNILREKANVKHDNLYNEIQEVVNSKNVPSYLSENIDKIRIIGNYAAHPQKSKTTGLIIEVEPSEAEYTLYLINLLFDFYFVMPAKSLEIDNALNEKK